MNNIEQLKEQQQQAKARYDFKALRQINEQIFTERQRQREQAKREREKEKENAIDATICKICEVMTL